MKIQFLPINPAMITLMCCNQLVSVFMSKLVSDMCYFYWLLCPYFLCFIFHCRKKITERVLKNLSEILEVSVKDVKTDNAEVIVLITEVFRALRNSCVSEPGNQHTIVVNTTAVESACSVVEVLLQCSGEESVICLQVCTQFLGNLIVNNKETQQIIWNKCSGILL